LKKEVEPESDPSEYVAVRYPVVASANGTVVNHRPRRSGPETVPDDRVLWIRAAVISARFEVREIP
jgi:hypothetical protein